MSDVDGGTNDMCYMFSRIVVVCVIHWLGKL